MMMLDDRTATHEPAIALRNVKPEPQVKISEEVSSPEEFQEKLLSFGQDASLRRHFIGEAYSKIKASSLLGEMGPRTCQRYGEIFRDLANSLGVRFGNVCLGRTEHGSYKSNLLDQAGQLEALSKLLDIRPSYYAPITVATNYHILTSAIAETEKLANQEGISLTGLYQSRVRALLIPVAEKEKESCVKDAVHFARKGDFYLVELRLKRARETSAICSKELGADYEQWEQQVKVEAAKNQFVKDLEYARDAVKRGELSATETFLNVARRIAPQANMQLDESFDRLEQELLKEAATLNFAKYNQEAARYAQRGEPFMVDTVLFLAKRCAEKAGIALDDEYKKFSDKVLQDAQAAQAVNRANEERVRPAEPSSFGRLNFSYSTKRDSRPWPQADDDKTTMNTNDEVRDGALAMAEVAMKLRDLRNILPGQQKEIYEFARLLSYYLNPTLVPEGLSLAMELLSHDLSQGIHGYSKRPIQSSLTGQPPMLYRVLSLSFEDIVIATCPKEFADQFKEVRKELRTMMLEK